MHLQTHTAEWQPRWQSLLTDMIFHTDQESSIAFKLWAMILEIFYNFQRATADTDFSSLLSFFRLPNSSALTPRCPLSLNSLSSLLLIVSSKQEHRTQDSVHIMQTIQCFSVLTGTFWDGESSKLLNLEKLHLCCVAALLSSAFRRRAWPHSNVSNQNKFWSALTLSS